MRLVYLVVGCLPVLGQTAGLSSVTKAPGEEVRVEISANSDSARKPIALRWDLIYPAQVMQMIGHNAGPAATDAGKSLQCTASKSYAYICTLSGGQHPIANGLIAILRFRIKSTAQAGPTMIRVEKAESTTADSKKWTLKDTEVVVTIR